MIKRVFYGGTVAAKFLCEVSNKRIQIRLQRNKNYETNTSDILNFANDSLVTRKVIVLENEMLSLEDKNDKIY